MSLRWYHKRIYLFNDGFYSDSNNSHELCMNAEARMWSHVCVVSLMFSSFFSYVVYDILRLRI
jgi:hypothetical protein